MRKVQHSVKVPQLYKAASRITKTIKEEGGSLKDLVFTYNCHLNIKGLYALILKAFQYEDTLDRLIKKSKILVNEERADPWLVRILITELLFGRQNLPGDSKPVQTVLSYQQKLLAELEKIEKKGIIQPDFKERQGRKLRFVRVNTLALTVAEALKHFHDEGWKQAHHERAEDYKTFLKNIASLAEDEFTQDFHIKELLIFPSNTEFFEHDLYLNGSIILQDKASCLASWLLNPPPGSVTLDMCAAPGMKTTHLAALMQNKGVLHAVEMNEKRYKVLQKQIENCGATCVRTLHMDALSLDAAQCPDVQYILVDPSCSGSGMVGRFRVENEEKHNASRLEKLAGFQILLLRHALTNFPDVKRVVYSTCSLNIEENEQVVDRVLSCVNTDPSNPIFQIANNSILENRWIHHGSPEYEWGHHCLYAQSDVDFTNGFFVAVFERIGSVVTEKTLIKQNDKKKKRRKKRKSNQESTDVMCVESDKHVSDNEQFPSLDKSATFHFVSEDKESNSVNKSCDRSNGNKQTVIKKKRKKNKFRKQEKNNLSEEKFKFLGKLMEVEHKNEGNQEIEEERIKSDDISENCETRRKIGNYENKFQTKGKNYIIPEAKEQINEKEKSKDKKKRKKHDKFYCSEQIMKYEFDNDVQMKKDLSDESGCLKEHRMPAKFVSKLQVKKCRSEENGSKKRRQEENEEPSCFKKQRMQIESDKKLQIKKDVDEIRSMKNKRKKHIECNFTEEHRMKNTIFYELQIEKDPNDKFISKNNKEKKHKSNYPEEHRMKGEVQDKLQIQDKFSAKKSSKQKNKKKRKYNASL